MDKASTRVEPVQDGWSIIVRNEPFTRHPFDASLTEATNWAFGDAWLRVVLQDGRSGRYSWSPDGAPIRLEVDGVWIEVQPDQIAWIEELR